MPPYRAKIKRLTQESKEAYRAYADERDKIDGLKIVIDKKRELCEKLGQDKMSKDQLIKERKKSIKQSWTSKRHYKSHWMN